MRACVCVRVREGVCEGVCVCVAFDQLFMHASDDNRAGCFSCFMIHGCCVLCAGAT